MNTLPITLTLYYPTMAQAESFIAFTAMLSIAASMLMLSLPIWYWTPRKTMLNGINSSAGMLVLCFNPVGAAALLLAHKLITELYNLPAVFNLSLYFLTPIAALWLYSGVLSL